MGKHVLTTNSPEVDTALATWDAAGAVWDALNKRWDEGRAVSGPNAVLKSSDGTVVLDASNPSTTLGNVGQT